MLSALLLALAAAPAFALVDAGAPSSSRADAGAPGDGGVAATADAGPTPEQLDHAALVSAAKDRQGDVYRCYAAALRDAPGLKGMIRMAWVVQLDGTTADVHVDETDLDDEPFRQCVLSALRAWRFPRPTGGAPVKIAYRWTLNPKARR